MGVHKLEEIRINLHFNDNKNMVPPNHPNHDRLHKI